MKILIFPTKIIPSVNHCYGHRAFGRRVIKYMTKQGKDFKIALANAWKQNTDYKYTGPIQFYVKLYYGDKRKHDVGNENKVIADALEGYAYDNDVQIMKYTAEKFYDKDNPRIEIYIEEYHETTPISE